MKRELCWAILACLLLRTSFLFGSAVPVRFVEGVVHGFLTLRAPNGDVIASGDLLQVVNGPTVESKTIFHFRDGSFSEERVAYTQKQVFALQSYHLIQRGPSFSNDEEVSMDRSGKYHVVAKHKDGKQEIFDGILELPPDTYNGMATTVVKNLSEGASETVHYVAFTPKPELIELEVNPTGKEQVQVGEVNREAVHYLLKPELGIWLKVLATLFGRVPPDFHAWVIKEEVPAFLRADGPLYMGGPVWRIELTGPRWDRQR